MNTYEKMDIENEGLKNQNQYGDQQNDDDDENSDSRSHYTQPSDIYFPGGSDIGNLNDIPPIETGPPKIEVTEANSETIEDLKQKQVTRFFEYMNMETDRTDML